VQYADWSARSPRWAGIRSEVADVRNTSVHLLRADANAEVPTDALPQLLLHPMAASATYWLDVLRPLTAYGPVIAPDLPGTFTGRTGLPRPNAARADINARFVRALIATLGVDRVVVHGWSMGGLVALLFADLAPERVEQLILANPTLPGSLTTSQTIGWQTAGRLALAVGPPVIRRLLRSLGPQLLNVKERYADPEAGMASWLDIPGGDLSRLSPETVALLAEERDMVRSQPRQLSGAVTAFSSVVAAMYVDRGPAEKAIGRVVAPTLLLWGDRDLLIDRSVINRLTERRPDWDLHVFETVGHLLPLEVPAAYVDVVGQWLAKDRAAYHFPPPTGTLGPRQS